MARILQCGFEQNSLTAGIEVDSITAPAASSVQTTIVRSGSYAALVSPATSAPRLDWTLYAANQAALGYARAYVRIDSSPSIACAILGFRNAAGTTTGAVYASGGNFLLVAQNGTQIGSATAYTAGVWYRVELLNDASGSGALTMRLTTCSGETGADPARSYDTEITGANSAVGSWNGIRIGCFVNSPTSGSVYFDDVALNTTSGSDQNSWCGHGRIIHLHVDSAGDQAQWTPSAGSNYQNVDEVPQDGTTTKNTSSTLNQEDLFNVEATPSLMTLNDTIKVVCVGGQHANITGADATTAFKYEVEKTTGGTISQSAAIIPNSTTYRTNDAQSCGLYPIVLYADPDAAAWTPAKLGTMQVGYKLTATNVRAIGVSTVYASVEYQEAGRGLLLRGCGT